MASTKYQYTTSPRKLEPEYERERKYKKTFGAFFAKKAKRAFLKKTKLKTFIYKEGLS